MLYDKRWDQQTKTPTAPTEQWRVDLLRAASIIRERGHCQNQLYDNSGTVCAVAAIALAANEGLFRLCLSTISEGEATPRYKAAATVVAKHLGGDSPVAICSWNNVRGRSGQDVINLFESLALGTAHAG